MSTRTPRPQLLVSTDWLARHLDDPQLRIFDATAHMISQPTGPSIVKSARPDWELGHIPNSAYLSMVDDLHTPGQDKPYAFPDARQVTESLRRLGVTQGSHIVLYGAGLTAAITRVWWVLRAYGMDKVSILDGGWPKWQREGRPVST
ncbi:MAG TPA: rhodanese-like domain-containing protein, partial [Ramlibacter sp.]|nr:rhodanese-like domain-containing protein [Ramlibacter sp.]